MALMEAPTSRKLMMLSKGRSAESRSTLTWRTGAGGLVAVTESVGEVRPPRQERLRAMVDGYNLESETGRDREDGEEEEEEEEQEFRGDDQES